MSKYSKWVTYAFIFLSLLTMVGPVFAAGPFQIDAGDKSKEIFLDALFGPLTGGGSGSPLSAVITEFNKAMLFVGGILVAYTLIAGTMSTAHDGQALGQKWSSMWVPIRTAIGTAAILPVLPGGFCFAQGVVVWLAMQGVGLANTLMNAYIGNGQGMLGGDVFYEPPSVQRPIRQVLETMLVANACVAALNTKVSQVDKTVANAFGMEELGGGALVSVHGYGYGVGNACGSVVVPIPASKAGLFNGALFMGTTQSMFDMNKFAQELASTHQEQLIASQGSLETLGEKIANGSGSDAELAKEVRDELDRLALNWSTALYEKGKATYAASANQDFLNKIKQDGWLMLGAWYIEIAKAQDAVTKGVTSVPNGTSAPDDAFGPVVGGRNFFRSLWSGVTGADVNEVIQKARAMASMMNNSNSGGGAVEDFANANTNTWTAKIVSWFINEDNNIFGENIGANANKNPVLMARNLGQNMTLMGWSAYGMSAVALVAGTQSAAGVGTSGLAAMVAPMVTALAGTIIVSGATLSTYIPMLPFILWIGVALGWAVLLVEAVIAAPLWAVTHLAPDGDGVVGRGGQGYMLVLSLVLRPGLMVLGFVCAVILMNPLGILINSTFMGAFLAGVNPSIFGLSQMIMGCVLYVVVMISVITRVFALIHIIPDKILRWIGGGAADLGETAGQIEGNTAAKVVAGAHVGQQLGQGMTEGARVARQNQLQDSGNREGKAGSTAQAYGNKFAQLEGTQRGMDGALADARSSSGDLNSSDFDNNAERVADAQNENATAAMGTAVASAHSAVARANSPGASASERSYGRQAEQFLKDIGPGKDANGKPREAINPNNAQQAKDFIAANHAKYANTQWGNTMAKSQHDRAHADTVMSDLSAARASAAPAPVPEKDPRQGELFDTRKDGDDNGEGGSPTGDKIV